MAQDIPLFVFGALDDPEDAPSDVVVDRRGLARPPDQRHDGKGAVRLGMQQVTAVAGWISIPLLCGQDLWVRHVQPQHIGDQVGRLCPAGPGMRRGPHSADQAAQTSPRLRLVAMSSFHISII
jgi:hypothetical protein